MSQSVFMVLGLIALAILAIYRQTSSNRESRIRSRSRSAYATQTQPEFADPAELEQVDFSQEVTGESRYQKAFAKICGPRCEDGEQRRVIAQLVPEPKNPFDANAVSVVVQGLVVGYLPRDDASMYRQMFGTKRLECDGMITGGWDRGGDRGHYGIRLAIREPRAN